MNESEVTDDIEKHTGKKLWIDIAKAITIILVIVGHTVSGYPNSVIFSFRMFLFFFLSAWTTRFSKSLSDFTAQLKKGVFHLLLPALIAFALEYVFAIAKLMWMTFISRYYPLFPLCYVCAPAGTLFVCQISWFISKIKLKNASTLSVISGETRCICCSSITSIITIHFFTPSLKTSLFRV